MLYIAFIIISITYLGLLISKKYKKVILPIILLVPFIVSAADSKFLITFENKNTILDKVQVKFIVFDDNLDMTEIGGKTFRYNGITGKRFYDEFDYIKFLNEGVDPNESK